MPLQHLLRTLAAGSGTLTLAPELPVSVCQLPIPEVRTVAAALAEDGRKLANDFARALDRLEEATRGTEKPAEA
jgi:hypothetical protein